MKRSHSYGSALDYSYSDKPISLAMIGAGRAGEFHVKSLSINKQFELKYIVDTDEDKANTLSGKVGCLFHHDINWVLQLQLEQKMLQIQHLNLPRNVSNLADLLKNSI